MENAQGQVVARLGRFLGIQTNNYAEYSGLLAVLEWALANGARRLRVVSDSELMVKQMKGLYKVKSPGLFPLWQEARRMAARLDGFEMRHTLRGEFGDVHRNGEEKGIDRPLMHPAPGRVESCLRQVGRPSGAG